MKYRIKHIIKHNGDEQFIPQFIDENWNYRVIICVVLFPIIFPLSIIDGTGIIWDYFFNYWKNIYIDEFIVNGDYVNTSAKATAEEIIKRHKQHHEAEKEKAFQEDIKKKGDQIKKTIYIKVKNNENI